MVGFTALKAVDMSLLRELRTIGHKNAHDRYANIEVSYARDVHGHKVVVKLVGAFTYDAGKLSGGVLDAVTVKVDGKTVYSFEGIGQGILPFLEQAALHRRDLEGWLAKLLAGDDDLTGSSKDDILIGFRGSDGLNGRKGDDRIFGGEGEDTLDGGRGGDVLFGGAAADSFVFSTPPDAKHVDTIRDFDPGADAILYEWDPYNGIVATEPATPQVITANQVHVGRHATTAGHRLVYDPRTGIFSYDPDGAGGERQVPVVKLAGAPDFDYAAAPFMFVI